MNTPERTTYEPWEMAASGPSLGLRLLWIVLKFILITAMLGHHALEFVYAAL
jgi:hypothetical protein